MKSKLWLIAVIAFLVVVAVLLLRYFFSSGTVDWRQIDSEIFQNQEKTSQPLEAKNIAEPKFDISLPAGWQEIAAPAGIDFMAVKSDELMTDLSSKKADFKSYFSLSHDQAGQMELDQYLNYYQQAAKQSLSSAEFSESSKLNLLYPARALEMTSKQGGSDYHAWLVFVQPEDETIWTIAFSSLASDWNSNKPIFDQVLASFKLIK